MKQFKISILFVVFLISFISCLDADRRPEKTGGLVEHYNSEPTNKGIESITGDENLKNSDDKRMVKCKLMFGDSEIQNRYYAVGMHLYVDNPYKVVSNDRFNIHVVGSFNINERLLDVEIDIEDEELIFLESVELDFENMNIDNPFRFQNELENPMTIEYTGDAGYDDGTYIVNRYELACIAVVGY